MMKQAIHKTIVVDHIVINGSNDVTLFCKLGKAENSRMIYLSMSLKALDDLLMKRGAGGRALLESIADKLMHVKTNPIQLNVANVLGFPLNIDIPKRHVWQSEVENIYFFDKN